MQRGRAEGAQNVDGLVERFNAIANGHDPPGPDTQHGNLVGEAVDLVGFEVGDLPASEQAAVEAVLQGIDVTGLGAGFAAWNAIV